MKNHHLEPQNGPRSSGTKKLLKSVSFKKKCFELVGKGGWPSISSWIIGTPRKFRIQNK
jgi:hypothetical protein